MSITGTLKAEPFRGRKPTLRRVTGRCLRVACGLWVMATGPAHGQSLLLGPPPAPPVRAPVDPALPTGASRFGLPRPSTQDPAACSFRWPVCVRRAAGVSDALTLAALASLEKAMERLVWGLGLPGPMDLGPKLYLHLTAGSADLRVVPCASWLEHFDRAAAYCVLGAGAAHDLDRAATLCAAEAIALGLDASASPHVRRAYATHVWWTVGAPASSDVDCVGALQNQPYRAVVARDRGPTSEGAALLFEYLESRFGGRAPVGLASSLLAISASHTRPGAWRFNNEPDLLDVLRATFETKPTSFSELLGDFATTRALLGSRESPLQSLAWTGQAAAMKYDWTLPLSTLPRRVAFRHPVEPTGLVAIWVPFDEPVKPPLTLAIRSEWEAPVAFQWVLVRVAAGQVERSRVRVPFQERGTMFEQRIVDLEGLLGLLIVGTNLGGIDLAHPFDPDISPYEPAGGTVYVTQL